MKLKRIILSFSLALAAFLPTSLVFSLPSLAACNSNDPSLTSGIDCATPKGVSQNPLFDSRTGLFTKIANVLIFVIGAIAVIMVIIGGLRYVLSSGNPQATAGAKDTILYAIIGVVVAALAFALVNFVIGKLG
jgi:hypothetical protein